MSGYIFISYSRLDGSESANRLYDRLLSNGYVPWMDRRDIRPGDLWQEQSDMAIRNCWLLLFLATSDSVRSRTCTAEWNRALTFKKPVVPLIFEEGLLLPLFLEQRQYVSFLESEEEGLQAILKYLSFLKSPEGAVRVLESRYHDLELELPRHPHPIIIEAKMRDLREQIEFKKRVLENPSGQVSHYRRELEVGMAEERTRFAKTRRNDLTVPRQRVVGTPPLGTDRVFKDRQSEMTQIFNYLTESEETQLVSIYGKAGSGKTALACEIMQQLEKQRDRVFGLTYHSTQNGNLDFERIYFSCARIMGGDVEKDLTRSWKVSLSNTENKVITLLNSLTQYRIVILLDNLEEVQYEDGSLRDPDLGLFLEYFLGSFHQAKILLTSREPLELPHRLRKNEKIVPLDEGLPIDDAVELLVELGKGKALGLAQPPKSILRTAVEKAFGYPRALEAIISILEEDSKLTLQRLITEPRIFNEKVLKNLVEEAFSRLSADSQIIVQSLAIFERPVPSTAVMHLLEPFANTVNVNGELERLAGKYFIKYNLRTKEYVLHPLDRDYSYSLIRREPTSTFNVKTLEQRAASYYYLLKTSSDEWSTLADLEPLLLAFPHLCKAEEFDEAARLLDSIENFLSRWGHLNLIIRMRSQIEEHIPNDQLRCKNYALLCDAYRRTGQGSRAIEYGEKALEIAEKINDRALENLCLGYLGRTLRNLGRVQEAVHYLERAINIAQEIDDPSSESKHIGNLGSSYYNLGDFERSIELLERSISISQSIGEGAERAARTGHLGHPYFHLGDYEKAIELYNTALTMTRGYRSRRGEGYWLWALGRGYSSSGSATEGIVFLEQGLEIAKEVGDKRLECFVLGALARTLLQLDALQEALTMTKMAIEIDVPELNANSEALHGVILALLHKSKPASRSLHEAIRLANALLSRTERFFEAKYSRAVSYATLAMIAQSEDRDFMLEKATQAYLDAISGCSAQGVLTYNRQLLSKITEYDSSDSLHHLLEIFDQASS